MRNYLALTTVALTICACGGGGGGSSGVSTELNETTDGTASASSTGGDTESPISDNTTATGTDMSATVDTSGGSVSEPTSNQENNGSSGAAGVTQFGIVIQDEDESVEFEASFYDISEPIAFPTFIEDFIPSSDTCDVSSYSLSAEVTELIDNIFNLDVTFISAGDVLTISSPAGSYAELLKSEEFGFVFYSASEDVILPIPAPANLSINIPGEQFPAFNNVAIPSTDPLQVNAPASAERFTASTTFSWVASSKPGSFIGIYASAISADFTEVTSVDCTVIDDGSFTFPAAIQSQMGAFSGTGDIERVSVNVERSGGAVLFLSSYAERQD